MTTNFVEGWLLKKSKFLSEWRPRYITISDEGDISWGKSQDDLDVNSYPLKRATIIENPTNKHEYAFVITFDNNIIEEDLKNIKNIKNKKKKKKRPPLYLAADDEEDMRKWIRCLTQASQGLTNRESNNERMSSFSSIPPPPIPTTTTRTTTTTTDININNDNNNIIEKKKKKDKMAELLGESSADINSVVKEVREENDQYYKRGWLMKKARSANKKMNWKTRYFKLEEGRNDQPPKLYYYAKDTDKDPKGVLELATDMTITNFPLRDNSFIIGNRKEDMYLQANDIGDKESWIKAFEEVLKKLRGDLSSKIALALQGMGIDENSEFFKKNNLSSTLNDDNNKNDNDNENNNNNNNDNNNNNKNDSINDSIINKDDYDSGDDLIINNDKRNEDFIKKKKQRESMQVLVSEINYIKSLAEKKEKEEKEKLKKEKEEKEKLKKEKKEKELNEQKNIEKQNKNENDNNNIEKIKKKEKRGSILEIAKEVEASIDQKDRNSLKFSKFFGFRNSNQFNKNNIEMNRNLLNELKVLNASSIKRGWLKKKSISSKRKKWTKRYFRLTEESLDYYIKDTDVVTKGSFPLDPSMDLKGYTLVDYGFKFGNNKIEIILQASNQLEKEEWMEAFHQYHEKAQSSIASVVGAALSTFGFSSFFDSEENKKKEEKKKIALKDKMKFAVKETIKDINVEKGTVKKPDLGDIVNVVKNKDHNQNDIDELFQEKEIYNSDDENEFYDIFEEKFHEILEYDIDINDDNKFDNLMGTFLDGNDNNINNFNNLSVNDRWELVKEREKSLKKKFRDFMLLLQSYED